LSCGRVVYRVEKSKVLMEDTWEKDLDFMLSKRFFRVFQNPHVIYATTGKSSNDCRGSVRGTISHPRRCIPPAHHYNTWCSKICQKYFNKTVLYIIMLVILWVWQTKSRLI
jgi:hypothetical protein